MPEEATQGVAEATAEGENQDELDSILDALDKDDTVVDAPAPTPSEDAPFKKIGDQVFKTEADYDAWALKNNGDVRRLTGELKKAQEAVKAAPSKETVNDVNAIRMQIKVADFFEANPDAVDHKDVIAALLRSGKALTLEDARVKALRAVGVEPKEKSNIEDIKNLSKVGGEGVSVGAGSYNSDNDVKGMSDFADNCLTNKI